ncbi:alpha/beta fold hydrolase [Agromyces silvae]|uniref:alpha/beta fold hydrolase n=1 Tax=Agromyces silvae TaxID=3388266 RepID=UPI00280B31F3|nr:alpha/beta hydrolase [Agromyces protaetiae]
MSELRTPTGDRIVFDRYGRAGAAAVVFIAGAGPTRADDPVTAETARRLGELGYQAIVHDRVGRGDSALPEPASISLEREIDAIAALARLTGGPVVLVGHSSGCAIAIRAAARVDRLAGLVLWEAPFGQFDGGAAAWWAKVDDRIHGDDLEGAVAEYMVDMPPEWLEGLRRSPEYPEVVLTWVPDGSALASVETDGLASALRDVQHPVLAVVGTETFPGMSEAAAQIARAAPNGSHEQVNGAWHTWDPEAMAARLATFCAEVSVGVPGAGSRAS